MPPYVENRDGGYFVAATRVSLDSVVFAYLRGEPVEDIVASYPSLTLEQTFGALAFYLANRDEIDNYLQREDAAFETLRAEARRQRPELYARIDAAREHSRASR